MRGAGRVVLGCPTIPVGSLPTSSVVSPSDSRASYLLHKVPFLPCKFWEGVGTFLLSCAVTCFQPSSSLGSWLTVLWLIHLQDSESTCFFAMMEVPDFKESWDCSISESNWSMSCSFVWVLHSLRLPVAPSHGEAAPQPQHSPCKRTVCQPNLAERHQALWASAALESYTSHQQVRLSVFLSASDMTAAVTLRATGDWTLPCVGTITEKA